MPPDQLAQVRAAAAARTDAEHAFRAAIVAARPHATLQQIADAAGLSRERIRQLLLEVP